MPPIPSHALRGADPSAASSAASETTDGAGLIGDAGPDFDPAAAKAEPPPIDLSAAGAGGASWQESRVRALLTAKGELVHGLAAVDPDSTEWRYTQADLAAIAPALTRILNRYDATRAAAAGGDEIQLGVGFLGYGMRSWSERRRDLAQLAAEQGYDDDDQAGDVAAAAAEPEPEPQAGADFPQAGDLPPIGPLRR